MLIPKPLAPGSHIQIISPGLPSLALMPDRASRADRALRAMGFRVSYGAHARTVSDDGIAAGTAADRAADLMAAFQDTSVDGILISDSGRGSRELIPWLDAADIVANPKPFVGYCDTAFLHQYLISQANLSSFVGCALMIQFGEGAGPFPETLEYFRQALMSADPLICQPPPSRTAQVIDWYGPGTEARPRSRDVPGGWTWLRQGEARGPLLGAEISILPGLIREFELKSKGVVLFWDVGFYNARPIHQQFEFLCRCTELPELAGMIVGAHPKVEPDQWAQTVSELVRDLLPSTTFPIIVNADISHLCPNWIVPYGEEVILGDARGVIFPRTG